MTSKDALVFTGILTLSLTVQGCHMIENHLSNPAHYYTNSVGQKKMTDQYAQEIDQQLAVAAAPLIHAAHEAVQATKITPDHVFVSFHYCSSVPGPPFRPELALTFTQAIPGLDGPDRSEKFQQILTKVPNWHIDSQRKSHNSLWMKKNTISISLPSYYPDTPHGGALTFYGPCVINADLRGYPDNSTDVYAPSYNPITGQDIIKQFLTTQNNTPGSSLPPHK